MGLLRGFFISKLTVKAYSTREDMGRNAAIDVASRIRKIAEQKGEVNMVFAAAPSQNEFLEELTSIDGICWDKINAFHMDEYIELDSCAPQAFGQFLKERLFSVKNFKSVHYIDGNASDMEAECRRYAALLSEYKPDIVCMGIGENGHIAFNDPWVADFEDKRSVKTVKLDDVCRWQQVHDGCFFSIDEVPTHAVTLTIPVLTGAKYIFCVVPARSKAQAVFNTLYGNISEACPASILRRHKNAVLYCDKDSAQLIDATFQRRAEDVAVTRLSAVRR